MFKKNCLKSANPKKNCKSRPLYKSMIIFIGRTTQNFLGSIIFKEFSYVMFGAMIGHIITKDNMNPPPPLKNPLIFSWRQRAYKSQNRMKGMNKITVFFLSFFFHILKIREGEDHKERD